MNPRATRWMMLRPGALLATGLVALLTGGKRSLKILIISATVVLLAITLTPVSYGDVWEIVYYVGSDGKVTSHKEKAMESEEDITFRFDDRGGRKVFCGACHATNDAKISAKLFDKKSSENHMTRYFPRAEYPLSQGQRYLDNDQTFYALEQGQLVLYNKDKAKLLVAPRGSRLLKDRSGRPAVVFFNGEPTVFNPPKKD